MATLLTVAGVAMIPLTHHLRHYLLLMPPGIHWVAMPLEILSSSIFVVYATVGLLLRLRQPDNPMGWWALLIAVAGGLNTFSGNYTLIAYLIAPDRWWPLASLAAWIEHWMTLGATAIGGIFIPLLFPFSLTAIFGAGRIVSGGQLTLAGNLFYFAFTFAWVLVAISLSLALLQHRLYDIDIIIRRTLVYSVLTALLAGIYFASVVLLQTIFRTVAGEQSTLVTVFSTLLIAALFSPLRRRVQEVIDRRFYRQKYDAQQVLARFAVTVRDEADLDKLTEELKRVVGETMQPEGAGVWLQKP